MLFITNITFKGTKWIKVLDQKMIINKKKNKEKKKEVSFVLYIIIVV